jgi:hypothetical protein
MKGRDDNTRWRGSGELGGPADNIHFAVLVLV